MTNTYLLELIKALNGQERQEMARFLASPMFNFGRNALETAKLFQVILQTAPDFPSDLLEKEMVYFQVFTDKRLVHGKLEKLMTELSQLLRVYVLTSRYLNKENDTKQQIEWATWLRERNLGDRALKVLEKIKNRGLEQRKESLEQYRTDLLIAEEKHVWESTHNLGKGDLDIAQVISHLDVYYQNYRIELQNRYLLQRKLTQLPELETYLENVHFAQEESILLQASKSIFQVLKKDLPTLGETQKMVEFLQRSEDLLSYQTLDHLYAYLRNFYTLLINSGNEEFLGILHNINKNNLERGFFLINGKIPPHAYLSIVIVSLRLREFEWAKGFTEQYKYLIIDGDNDRFYYRLNMVYCFFAEGLFEEALECMPEPPANSIYLQKIRRLELQIYYELRSDLLEYKIDAFRKYNERTASKSIATNVREMNVNFLNILLQLSHSHGKSKTRSAQLMKRINSKKFLAERAWLLEKARKLG